MLTISIPAIKTGRFALGYGVGTLCLWARSALGYGDACELALGSLRFENDAADIQLPTVYFLLPTNH